MLKMDKSKVTMNLGKREKLAPYLDKAINSFDREWEFKYTTKVGDDAWHPSGDCTPSAYELWQKATGEVEHKLTGLNKAFQVGHFWHQWLQLILVEDLEFCVPEHIERRGIKTWGSPRDRASNPWQPKPFHWATGAADAAPCVIPKIDWRGIVDFKTMNPQMFAQKSVPFADKYECQFNIYMDFFDEERALLLGINKATGEFKEFEFLRNQPLIDTIYEKWQYISDCLDANEEPEQWEDEDDPFKLPLLGPVRV